ncbi:MAG: acyl-CoA thioesterase [Hymenobacter sp.]
MDTPAAPTHAYSHTFTVEASDIDQLGHVNNVAYVRWVQEVAAAHWHRFCPPTAALAPQVWVVQEHRVRYLAPRLRGRRVARLHLGSRREGSQLPAPHPHRARGRWAAAVRRRNAVGAAGCGQWTAGKGAGEVGGTFISYSFNLITESRVFKLFSSKASRVSTLTNN